MNNSKSTWCCDFQVDNSEFTGDMTLKWLTVSSHEDVTFKFVTGSSCR